MGVRLFLLGKVPAFIASTGVALILSTKPDDVIENVQIWSARLGLDHPPAWTQTAAFGTYAPPVSIALLCFVALWMLWPALSWMRRKFRAPRAGARVFVPASVSLNDLVEPFESHTQIDARSLTAKYIGRWIRIEGAVAEALKAPGGAVFLLHKKHFFLGPTAHMRFTGRQATKAAMLKKGSPVAATGRIAAIEFSRVLLHDCELDG